MIPKIIHYCWFGRNPLPPLAIKCIESWKKYLPDYEIKEWNEDNFDINICQYTREAYEAKKYAFVSDYARFWILYHYGGLYFDTDVEVIKPMYDIIERGAFMGIEKSLATQGKGGHIGVAPGLALGAEKNLPIYKDILEYYIDKSYFDEQGTVVTNITSILKKHGLKNDNILQSVAGLTIYPADVFCPMDSTSGIVSLTSETVSIHHYSCSWIDKNTLSFKLHLLKNRLIRIFGKRLILFIATSLKK